jgi:hypothetical protein
VTSVTCAISPSPCGTSVCCTPVVLEDLGHRRLRVRAGHRRLAAAHLAGLTRVPAVIHPEALDDDEWLIAAAHENTRRRDLTPADRAHAITAMRAAGLTTAGIAAALAISPSTVTQTPTTATTPGSGPTGGSTGRRGRRGGQRVSRARLTALVADYRARPDTTAGEVLDALDRLLNLTPTGTTDTADTHAQPATTTDEQPDHQAEEQAEEQAEQQADAA